MIDDKLWIVFSEWIRLRDADQDGNITCITCGRKHFWKGTGQVNAGHFMSRKDWATRYDHKNVNAQCVACNKWGSGNQYEHGIKIDEKYGAGTANDLFVKSKMTVKKMDKTTIAYYTKFYKAEVKKLKESKGL